jgi:hypothetical protein
MRKSFKEYLKSVMKNATEVRVANNTSTFFLLKKRCSIEALQTAIISSQYLLRTCFMSFCFEYLSIKCPQGRTSNCRPFFNFLSRKECAIRIKLSVNRKNRQKNIYLESNFYILLCLIKKQLIFPKMLAT